MEMPSKLALEQDHSIKIKFVAQQWLVRIEEEPEEKNKDKAAGGLTGKVMKVLGKYLKKKQPKRYYIDRQKL